MRFIHALLLVALCSCMVLSTPVSALDYEMFIVGTSTATSYGNCSSYSQYQRGVGITFSQKTLITALLNYDFSCGLVSSHLFQCASPVDSTSNWSLPVSVSSPFDSLAVVTGCIPSGSSSFASSNARCAILTNLTATGLHSAFYFDNACWQPAGLNQPSGLVAIGIDDLAYAALDVNPPSQNKVDAVFGFPMSPMPVKAAVSANWTLHTYSPWSQCSITNFQRYFLAEVPKSSDVALTFVEAGFTCMPAPNATTTRLLCFIQASNIVQQLASVLLDLTTVTDDKTTGLDFSTACLQAVPTTPHFFDNASRGLLWHVGRQASKKLFMEVMAVDVMYQSDGAPTFDFVFASRTFNYTTPDGNSGFSMSFF